MIDKTWNIFLKNITIEVQKLYYLHSHHFWFCLKQHSNLEIWPPILWHLHIKSWGLCPFPLNLDTHLWLLCPRCCVTSKVRTEKIMQFPPESLETLANLQVRRPLPWAWQARPRVGTSETAAAEHPDQSQHQLPAEWGSWHLTTIPWETPVWTGQLSPAQILDSHVTIKIKCLSHTPRFWGNLLSRRHNNQNKFDNSRSTSVTDGIPG